MSTTLAVVALLLALVALALSVMALLRAKAVSAPAPDDELAGVPEDVLGLRQEVAALSAEAAGALRHLAVVRYDAFADMGGQLSWSVALLDDSGSGVVLTSIQGRTEARTYAKSISEWECEQALSPEERDAVDHTR